MIYDKDLRLQRFISAVLGVANCYLAVRCFAAHGWLFGLTSMVWAISCLWFRTSIRYHQHMRDALRVAQAGMNALREEHEREQSND